MAADKKNKNPGMVCNDDACMRIPMLDGYPAKMTLSEYEKHEHARLFDDIIKAAKHAIKINGQLYTEVELKGGRLLFRKGVYNIGTVKWAVVKRSEPNTK